MRAAVLVAALCIPAGCGSHPPPVELAKAIETGMDCLTAARSRSDLERCAVELAADAQRSAVEACAAGGSLLAVGIETALAYIRRALGT